MPLEPPRLDTRTFDQLRQLALQRIPRYTPEWTDFNTSDPGITLVELFAWLTELMLYEFNRIPELNYVKFLQLLGLEPAPARPALAHLTFTPRPDTPAQPVPARAQIAAQSPDGGQAVFETETELGLVRLPLGDVRVFDGVSFLDATPANGTGQATYRPLGWVPQPDSALYLGFTQTDPPAQGRLFPQALSLRVALPAAARGSAVPAVRLEWEYRPTPSRWRRLNVLLDESAQFTRDGYLLLQGPADAVATTEADVPEPRLWLRARLAEGVYPSDAVPEVEFIRPNTVAALQLATFRDELLGLSSARPDQVFRLRHTPVAPGSPRLAITEAEGSLPWQLVDDFLASTPEDRHYTLDAVTGEVRFGDGAHGRIPVDGAEVVAVEYRAGGGLAGNVGPGQIGSLLTPLNWVDSVTNDRAAEGGRDEESVEELKRRAPAVLRRRGRAVTAEDFASLAVEAGGVARAVALPLAHPEHPGVPVPGAVTCVIVPDSDDRPPVPSQALREQVAAFLAPHRLITTELHITGPDYVPVTVHAAISARTNASPDRVAADVSDALDAHLSPLTRQDGRRGGRPFGRDLHPTSLYAVILAVPDVTSVDSLSLTVRTTPWDHLEEPIQLPADALLYGTGEHDLTVRPEVDR